MDSAAETTLIQVQDIVMDYPLPRRFRQILLRPFARRSYTRALDGLSLAIGRGERVAFLGPNGAGKTSLLKLIAGLLLPGSGRVLVGGVDTAKDDDPAGRRASLVLNEERSFYWRLSGRENLEFFGALEGMRGAVLGKRIDELKEVVDLGVAMERPVSGYSSGMRQRLALARGLLTDPEILILDEPSRALDPLAASEMVDFLVERLHRDLAKTLLVATHSLSEAMALCERLCVVSGGRLRADRSVESVRRDYPDPLGFYAEAVGA